MYAPECPDAVLDIQAAELPGHRRCFNKRSYVRGCQPGQQRWKLDVPAAFARPERQFSLALGTTPGDSMVGRIVRYDARRTDEVLRALDQREGYDPAASSAQNGYNRVLVDLAVSGASVRAWAYLGNPLSELHCELDLEQQARVLIAATPREGAQAKRGGLEYLVEARATLARGGIADPHLDALWTTVRGLPGPWQDWLRELA